MEPATAAPSREAVLLSWWGGLDRARGDRAALRRCAAASDVAFAPAYHRLLARLEQANHRVDREDLAVLAGVLAHVEEHDGEHPFARQLAARKGDKARLSGLRFRRLLAIDAPDALLVGLVRVVRLLDRRANVTDLAESILSWNDRTRKRWAFAYYANAPADKK